jgi:3-phenylpropionate/trans-cinnamate dioxygenase ferredoxin reductase subunit
MEYVGHASPDAEVVVRGDLDGREFVAFYLDDDGRVAAGMHADVWDATDVIRELIGRRVDRDVLGDDAVDLGDLPDHTAD